jgi:hypothetical protein
MQKRRKLRGLLLISSFRRPLLYPVELRARMSESMTKFIRSLRSRKRKSKAEPLPRNAYGKVAHPLLLEVEKALQKMKEHPNKAPESSNQPPKQRWLWTTLPSFRRRASTIKIPRPAVVVCGSRLLLMPKLRCGQPFFDRSAFRC